MFRRLPGALFDGAEYYESFGLLMSCQLFTIPTLGLIFLHQQLHVVEGSVVFDAIRDLEPVHQLCFHSEYNYGLPRALLETLLTCQCLVILSVLF